MPKDLTFQLIALHGGKWGDVLGQYKRVEELDFDMVTTGDHFVDCHEPSRPWFEVRTLRRRLRGKHPHPAGHLCDVDPVAQYGHAGTQSLSLESYLGRPAGGGPVRGP